MTTIVSFPRSGTYLLKSVLELSCGAQCSIVHKEKQDFSGSLSQVCLLSRDIDSVLDSLWRQRVWWGFDSCLYRDLMDEALIRDLLVKPNPSVKLVEVDHFGIREILEDAEQPFDWWEQYKDLTILQAYNQFYKGWAESGVPVISFEQLINEPTRTVVSLARQLQLQVQFGVRFPSQRVGRFILGEEVELDQSRGSV